MTAAISREIREKGPIPFSRFMELALYEPESGYYAKGKARVGKHGDYYTSVSTGRAFGAVLAGVFEDMWTRMGEPSGFVVMEQGANDGQLAADVLASVSSRFRDHLRYRIVEPLPRLREIQAQRLAPWHDLVVWTGSLTETAPFSGVHFSNELVDALPFHLLKSTGSEWLECFVTFHGAGDGYDFVDLPVSVSAKSAAEALPRRPAGVFAEVRPAAVAWISDVARILTRGYLLALDYGFSRKERLAPHRMRGTFASYKNHHRDENLLADPGERDLTAHVDFSDLAGAGLAAGLVPVGFCDQHHFMIGAASKLLKTLDGTDPASDPHKLLHSLKTLMHPETMGTRFQAFAMTTHPDLATCLPAFRASWDGFSELIP